MLPTSISMRIFWPVSIAALACALVVSGALSDRIAQAESIYSFVDGNGVIHFSNAPTDPRYKKVALPGESGPRLASQVSPVVMHQAITKSSAQHQVDPNLVRAVIKAESSFNSKAVSRKGAMGLMQLMPETATALKIANPYDPEQNIAGGVRHLRYLLDRFRGNVPLALAAYNAGETRVTRDNRIPRINETREYVRKVLRFYKAYRQQAGKPLAAHLQYVSSN
jgi:soluble lytic murein transglycosylase-like protein